MHGIPAIVMSLSVNGLGVARSLGRHGVPVIGIARSSRDSPGAHSRFVRRLWRFEGVGDAVVAFLLRRRGICPPGTVLFPITDRSVQSIARHWDEVGGHYRLGLPQPSLVEAIMSKCGFVERAAAMGFPVPQTVFVDGSDDIEQAARRVRYPCIIKPEFQSPRGSPSSALKTARAETPEQLIEACTSLGRVHPRLAIQEWLGGGDGSVHFCLQYYDRHCRPLATFCGRKIRQWPPLHGSTASCEPVDDPEMQRMTTQFFTRIGFHGLCSMEYKRDPRTGRLVMIEPTVGRTDWQSAVADINGVAIPYVAYCDLTGAETPELRPTRMRYRWVRWPADRASAEHYIARGELTLTSWLWSIRPPVRWSTWSCDDPRPCLASLLPRLTGKARKVARRLLLAGRGDARKPP
jgi:predicted ATP-grasp superfamily ATP-dependent carboligase